MSYLTLLSFHDHVDRLPAVPPARRTLLRDAAAAADDPGEVPAPAPAAASLEGMFPLVLFVASALVLCLTLRCSRFTITSTAFLQSHPLGVRFYGMLPPPPLLLPVALPPLPLLPFRLPLLLLPPLKVGRASGLCCPSLVLCLTFRRSVIFLLSSRGPRCLPCAWCFGGRASRT